MRCVLALRSKPVNVGLAIAAIFVLLFSKATFGQNTPPHYGTKASPRIGVAFSKAAVKALLTIEGTRDKGLLDAAMIDLSAAQSTHAELTVVWHIQLFQEIYGIHELTRQMRVRAEKEESLAHPDGAPADHGANGAHDEDQACIVAWLPRLRALSAEIPKQCPRFSPEEMKTFDLDLAK